MSTISGSCGTSEAQLLFERGIQEHQAQRLQQNHALQAIQQGGGGQSIGIEPTVAGQVAAVEPGKGGIIDVYV